MYPFFFSFSSLFLCSSSLFHGLSSGIFFSFVLKYWIYADSSTHFWFTIDHGWIWEQHATSFYKMHRVWKKKKKIIISPQRFSTSIILFRSNGLVSFVKSTYDIYQSITIFTILFLPFYLVKMMYRSFIWTKSYFFLYQRFIIIILLLDRQ